MNRVRIADVRVGPDGLEVAGRAVGDGAVLGFHERLDAWRGRLWLDVAGAGVSVAVDDSAVDAYGRLRAALRARWPRRPFTAAWGASGGFPGRVLGGPPAPLTAALAVVALALSGVAGAVLGVGVGAAVGVVLGLGVGRLRPRLVVGEDGVRAGPAWAPSIGWHELDGVRLEARGATTRVHLLHRRGVVTVGVAAVVVPAVRARLLRLGGLEAEEGGLDLDAAYHALRPVALGAPWGVAIAGLAVAPLTSVPWEVVAWTAVAAALSGVVGAAATARADGWKAGGVVWMMVAWGVVLLGLALGLAS
jgi:hypothetical protein